MLEMKFIWQQQQCLLVLQDPNITKTIFYATFGLPQHTYSQVALHLISHDIKTTKIDENKRMKKTDTIHISKRRGQGAML